MQQALDCRLSDFAASSAGTRAVIGHPMHREAAQVLYSLGGDASGFSARQLTARIVTGADLVLTMSRAHRESVLELVPRKLHTTYTLVEAAEMVSRFGASTIEDLAALRPRLSGQNLADIPDPIGGKPELYRSVGRRIAELVSVILALRPSSA